jgi:hypothetical protein
MIRHSLERACVFHRVRFAVTTSLPDSASDRHTAQDIRSGRVFDCGMANDPATINKESTNENNTDVDRWVDARRLRINGKPCS